MSPYNKFWQGDIRTADYLRSLISQTESWIEGTPKHNPFSNECCIDFSCCVPDMLSPEIERMEIGGLEILALREELMLAGGLTEGEGMSGFHICSFSDPKDYRIQVDGKVYIFDFSPMFGPSFYDRRRNLVSIRPRHPFWKGFEPWLKQGKRVDMDGLCVWEPESEMDLSDFVKIGKRTYVAKSIFESMCAKNPKFKVLGTAERQRHRSGRGIHKAPEGEMSFDFVDESLREVTGDLDGPPCHVCGAIMVPVTKEGPKFFRCLSCGTETRPS